MKWVVGLVAIVIFVALAILYFNGMLGNSAVA